MLLHCSGIAWLLVIAVARLHGGLLTPDWQSTRLKKARVRLFTFNNFTHPPHSRKFSSSSLTSSSLLHSTLSYDPTDSECSSSTSPLLSLFSSASRLLENTASPTSTALAATSAAPSHKKAILPTVSRSMTVKITFALPLRGKAHATPAGECVRDSIGSL